MTRFQKFLRIFTVSGMAVLTSGIGMASANVDFSNFNNTTGARSENIGRISANRDWLVDWINNGRIQNDIQKFIRTGNNDVSQNTTVLGLQSGSVDVTSRFSAPLLNGAIDFGLGNLADETITASSSNVLTGANSDNQNIINAQRSFTLRARNSAQIDNRASLDVTTGNNDASRNTSIGDVISGDVIGSIDFENGGMISPLTNLDLSGSSLGDISGSFANGTTGFGSENINVLNSDSNVEVSIENDSQVTNEFQIDANTGGNNIDENTLVGNVRSGDVTLDLRASQ